MKKRFNEDSGFNNQIIDLTGRTVVNEKAKIKYRFIAIKFIFIYVSVYIQTISIRVHETSFKYVSKFGYR